MEWINFIDRTILPYKNELDLLSKQEQLTKTIGCLAGTIKKIKERRAEAQ